MAERYFLLCFPSLITLKSSTGFVTGFVFFPQSIIFNLINPIHYSYNCMFLRMKTNDCICHNYLLMNNVVTTQAGSCCVKMLLNTPNYYSSFDCDRLPGRWVLVLKLGYSLGDDLFGSMCLPWIQLHLTLRAALIPSTLNPSLSQKMKLNGT